MVAQFMHKGESINITIDGKTTSFTFEKEGSRAKDKLALVSTPNEIMSPQGSGVIREGLTREFERDNFKNQIGDRKDYDIRRGITYLVNLDESRNEQQSTIALIHEMAVHVDPNVKRALQIESKIMNGKLKPGTQEYLIQLYQIKTSGSVDHRMLGQEKNSKYQNIVTQLDRLKNSKQYTELYKEDVKENK